MLFVAEALTAKSYQAALRGTMEKARSRRSARLLIGRQDSTNKMAQDQESYPPISCDLPAGSIKLHPCLKSKK